MPFSCNIRFVWVVVLCGLGLLSNPASAQTGLGALAEFLPPTGQSDVWRYANTGDSFEIENVGDPQAIQYFYVGPEDGREGRRTIEAGLNVHPDSTGAAGLLYGLSDNRDVYHMLTLDAAGMVALYRRDSSGFRLMLEQSSSAYLPEKINRLTIQESGSEITFSLNDTSLGSVSGDLYGRGAVGLGAIGDVRAFFTYFSDGSDGPRSDLDPASQTPQTHSASLPSDMLQMQRFQIVDTQGPAGQMVAYETLIPEGWKTQGGIMWNGNHGQSGCFTGARLVWGTGTPDDSYGIVFLDPMSWGVTTYGPSQFKCLPQDLPDTESVMRAYFQIISGMMQVTIKEIQRPPELEPVIASFAQNWVTNAANARAWVDGALITASTQSETGQNDAHILAITKHMEGQADASSGFRFGETGVIIALYTPPGKLEEGHPAFGQILNNLRVNPQWQQVEAQWLQQYWKTVLRRPTPVSGGATSSSSTSVGDMMFESWKRREGMQDAGHASSVNGIWEVQPWQTSSGNTVLLNQNYNHAWEMQNGSIVLTNDANFNPMQSLNQTGQEMRREY